MVRVTLVDSNVWIFLNIEEAPEHAAACGRIDQLSETGLQINDIIVSEVFHKLSRLASPSEARKRAERILASRYVLYEPLRFDVIRKGLSLAVRHRMRINDAVIAAQALDLGTDLLTDNVRDFRRLGNLKVRHLRQ